MNSLFVQENKNVISNQNITCFNELKASTNIFGSEAPHVSKTRCTHILNPTLHLCWYILLHYVC